MSRLDEHVSVVRRRMLMARFLDRLAITLMLVAIGAAVGVLVNRLLAVAIPHPWYWLGGGAIVAVVGAYVWALRAAPSAIDAAVHIDERLGLKEKFSTALHVRREEDPFARAAVADAEREANGVSLSKRFPIEWPKRARGTAIAGAVAALTLLVPSMDLFGKEEAQQEQIARKQQEQQAAEELKKAIEQIKALPEGLAASQEIQDAQKELEEMLKAPPQLEDAKRAAMKAQQETEDSLKKQLENTQQFADAKAESTAFRDVAPDNEQETGLVAEAQKSMARGEFDKAADALSKAAEEFNNMSQEEKEQAARQMGDMASKLDKIGNNTAMQQQIQNQFQQMGASPQQAQQMMQQMQQAAAGNQQAQQQLQQSMNNLQQQMNNGQGPSPMQQQQLQQLMQQMQAQANAQQQAQQMSQQAQQMANSMQSQCQGGSGNPSTQPSSSSSSSSASASMCNSLSQMQGRQASMQQGRGLGSGAGRGRGSNGAPPPPLENYQTQAESAPTTGDPNGPILAKFLVKDPNNLKGESRQQLREIAEAAQNDAIDEVQTQRVSREAQSAVKSYFSSMGEEAPAQE